MLNEINGEKKTLEQLFEELEQQDTDKNGQEESNLEALIEMINSGQAENIYLMDQLMKQDDSSSSEGENSLSLEALFDIINSGQAENYYLMDQLNNGDSEQDQHANDAELDALLDTINSD